MQSNTNTNSENNNDNQSVPTNASESQPVHTLGPFGMHPVTASGSFGTYPVTSTAFGALPVTASGPFSTPPVTAPGPLIFGAAKHPNTQSGGLASTGAFGSMSGFGTPTPRGCCNPFPPNTQRHPETGLPIPPTQPVFGFRSDQQFSQSNNVSKDKLIEELYTELRRLQQNVNESNKLIGSMYELLRKL